MHSFPVTLAVTAVSLMVSVAAVVIGVIPFQFVAVAGSYYVPDVWRWAKRSIDDR